MNVLITGGAGYIGSVITNRFIKKHKVVVVDNLSTTKKDLINPKCVFEYGDILNTKFLDKLFKKYHFDLVIHLAAKTVVPESVKKPKLYERNNVGGTNNILKAMTKYGCHKIIFASSAATYGEPKVIPIKEDSAQKPVNPYGSTKLKAEQLIKKTKNINYVIFRFFNVAGASNDLKYGMMKEVPTLLVPAVNKRIGEKQLPIVFGNKYKTKDGTCLRDYVHVEDLATACELALPLLDKSKSNIFNLGSGKGHTVLEVVKCACQVNKIKFAYILQPPRAGDPARLLTDISKAKKILKWIPKYSLVQMVKSDYLFRKSKNI